MCPFGVILYFPSSQPLATRCLLLSKEVCCSGNFEQRSHVTPGALRWLLFLSMVFPRCVHATAPIRTRSLLLNTVRCPTTPPPRPSVTGAGVASRSRLLRACCSEHNRVCAHRSGSVPAAATAGSSANLGSAFRGQPRCLQNRPHYCTIPPAVREGFHTPTSSPTPVVAGTNI